MVRNIGELRQHIVITRTVGNGDPILVTDCMAAVRGMSGREFAAAGGVQAEAITTFTCRYRQGVEAGQQILYDGDRYEILYVNRIQGDRYLEIKARSVKGVKR